MAWISYYKAVDLKHRNILIETHEMISPVTSDSLSLRFVAYTPLGLDQPFLPSVPTAPREAPRPRPRIQAGAHAERRGQRRRLGFPRDGAAPPCRWQAMAGRWWSKGWSYGLGCCWLTWVSSSWFILVHFGLLVIIYVIIAYFGSSWFIMGCWWFE